MNQAGFLVLLATTATTVTAVTTAAHAEQPVTDVQLFQGPVIASARTLALGGAYTAMGEGIDGLAFNAAAPAVRALYSTKRFDYDFTASGYLPATLSATDFENRGTSSDGSRFQARRFIYVTAGVQFQADEWGFAVLGDYQFFDVADRAAINPLSSLAVGRWHAGVARSFFDQQLSVGVGVRIAHATFTNGFSLRDMVGASPEVGAVFRRTGQPYRLGATLRSPLVTNVASLSTDATLGSADPWRVVMPTEIEVGAAIQFGPRPMNPRWLDPRTDRPEDHDAGEQTRKARYVNWPRERILVMASLLAVAPRDGARSMQSFFNRIDERYGERWSLTPRYGVETEPIRDWLIVRAGGYLEPSRFDFGTSRQHVTVGVQARMFGLAAFRIFGNDALSLSLVADMAPRYFNWGIGLNLWR